MAGGEFPIGQPPEGGDGEDKGKERPSPETPGRGWGIARRRLGRWRNKGNMGNGIAGMGKEARDFRTWECAAKDGIASELKGLMKHKAGGEGMVEGT